VKAQKNLVDFQLTKINSLSNPYDSLSGLLKKYATRMFSFFSVFWEVDGFETNYKINDTINHETQSNNENTRQQPEKENFFKVLA